MLLRIRILPHDTFRLSGKDVLTALKVTPWEAALGAQIDIPTLKGNIKLSVPPGAASGQRLRLKGRGLPVKTGKNGDLLVEIKIVLPPKLSEAERELHANRIQVEVLRALQARGYPYSLDRLIAEALWMIDYWERFYGFD